MSIFTECESYKHKFAKKIVKEWFDNSGDGHEWKTFKTTEDTISFRSNRDIGVWEEYPVTIFKYDNYISSSIEQLWDETIDYTNKSLNYDLDIKEAVSSKNINVDNEIDEFIKNYKIFESLQNTELVEFYRDKKNVKLISIYSDIRDYIHSKYSIIPPTYEESLQHGNTFAIFDLAIAHKGQIKYGIEICHTNPVAEKKIRKLYDLGLENLIELDAEWILNQIEKPEIIKVKRWLIKDGHLCI
jgi:hypothetical protein